MLRITQKITKNYFMKYQNTIQFLLMFFIYNKKNDISYF